jgi:phosphohistidine phosphatase SixA
MLSLVRIAALLVVALLSIAPTRASEEAAWAALKQGAIVLIRHANAPGGGDPPGMRLGDCTTQRNLDATGRTQAARIGASFKAKGIAVGAVLASEWCRTTETAELAFPGQVRASSPFNSFFGARDEEPARTAAARQMLEGWQGPGALVAVTHHVNIGRLTGVYPASGEGIVVRLENGAVEVVGRIRP